MSTPVGSVASEPGGMPRGFMNVISFDLHGSPESAVEAELVSLRTLPGPVYAAADALYIGERRYFTDFSLTGAHEFDISGGSARYTAKH